MRTSPLHISATLVALSLFLFSGCEKAPEKGDTGHNTINLVSYNMLFEYTVPAEKDRQWSSRCPHALETFRKWDFDIIGTQELLTTQVNDLLADGTYGRIGKNNNGTTADRVENEAILYKTSRFTVLQEGQFWYSDTPSVPASKWGIHNRCCCWAKFRERHTGQVFWVFNSHFHVNAPDQNWSNGLPFTNEQANEIRVKSARLLLQTIKDKVPYTEPVFITGDLNCTDGDDPVNTILADGRFRDARMCVSLPEGPKGTLHSFKTTTPTRRIDWIFAGGEVTLSRYRVIDEQQKTGKWESDHLPVLVTWELPGK